MKDAFRDELELIFRSIWFWIGFALILVIEIFIPIQTKFGTPLLTYQFSYNAQYLAFLPALMAAGFSYYSKVVDADASGYPTRLQFFGQLVADSMIFTLVLLLTTFPKFLIVEALHGGYSDRNLALFTIGAYWIYFFLQSAFLIISGAIGGRCFYVLVHHMPVISITTLAFGSILMPITAGVYADMIHSVTDNVLAGSYSAQLLESETAIKLTGTVLLQGLLSLGAMLLLIILAILMTFRYYRQEKEQYIDYHTPKEQ